MYLSLFEEETAMILKRTRDLSSETFFRIVVIDGVLALNLEFSIYGLMGFRD
jgi:hypothetical protein